MVGIPAGVPILAGILSYFTHGLTHAINVDWRKSIDEVKSALGKTKPATLGDLVTVIDSLLKWMSRYKACAPEHAAGVWRLVAMMYKSGVDETLLLG
jgi:hypothetical protein